ncbi:hypothetical protein K7432_003242 [Basidiobolus ranarum]|uniref:NodB homology domain-containing protein n=1 Tax=Basidiobolus ranarum TaxID=34480 RepID=A0ABR2W6I1_9FUNG
MSIKSSLIIGCALIASTVAEKQCVPYQTSYDFTTGFPPVWVAPGQKEFDTPEFQKVYHSIDWSKVPNIPPRRMNAAGEFVSPYSASDPDCWWTYSGCTTPKDKYLKPDLTACPEPDTWGLTFDGGPNCTQHQFYDFLRDNNQLATMFYIGSNVADWPRQAKRGLTDGHHICLHTWSHPYMTTVTNEVVVGEFYYTMKVIKMVLGVTPTCWRPPYGDVDDRVRAIAKQIGLTTIMWNLDSDDWMLKPAGKEPPSFVDARFQSFIDMAKNGTFAHSGTITLEHELDNATMSMAEKWLPKIRKAFKHVMPVATCMNMTTPYTETEFTYPDFIQYSKGDTNGNALKNATHNATSSTSSSSSSSTSSSDSSSTSSSSSSSTASKSANSTETKHTKSDDSSDHGKSTNDSTKYLVNISLTLFGLASVSLLL